MQLPPRPDGTRPSLPESDRQLLIIGANGAGKTRFADAVVASVDPALVFPLSPLAALFGTFDPAAPPHSVDGLYAAAMQTSPLIDHQSSVINKQSSQFDRLIGLMIHEEVINLLRFKVEGGGRGTLPETILDRVLSLWQEIFPDNGVLRADGQILFTDSTGGSVRSGLKLSAGEKLVLYYFGAVLHAPQGAVIPVDSPGMFLHPSTLRLVWDRVESLRPDCRFIYVTHDLDFASTRSSATTVWVRGCDPANGTYDYDILPPDTMLSEEMYMTILGARRPVLFIEGDATRSIDAKLYPLIFPEYTVKALGSCDRVIESTRVFNSLGAFHHLDSCGLVDRDRRSPQEVDYLRRKRIMVPEVAEVENLLMLEEVIRTVAAARHRDPDRAFHKVKSAVMAMFRADLRQQALQHTRHAVKRTVEHRIDGRFADISRLEDHLAGLVDFINPRAIYEDFCREFHGYLQTDDYASVLRVYNQKSMLPQSNVAGLTGCADKQGYIAAILDLLKSDTPFAPRLRAAIRAAFQ